MKFNGILLFVLILFVGCADACLPWRCLFWRRSSQVSPAPALELAVVPEAAATAAPAPGSAVAGPK